MRKLLIALLSLALTSSVGAQSCCDRDGVKVIPGSQDCLYFPNSGNPQTMLVGNSHNTSSLTMDLTGEKAAFIGYLYINGRPSSAKNCTAAGGCSISWLPATTTFSNASTSLDIGIQGISSATNPTQPDGTYGVKGTLVPGTETITTSTWNTADMETDGADTSYSHGDLISVVWDMTARAGSDSVIIRGFHNGSSGHIPSAALQTSGTWATQVVSPNVIITFDDGTIGWIDGGHVIGSATNSVALNTSTTPDEAGTLFSLPFDYEIDQLWAASFNGGAANADYEIVLYSDPLGTSPVAERTVTVDDKWHRGLAVSGNSVHLLANPLKARRGYKYAVTVRPTSTNGVSIPITAVASSGHLAAHGGSGTVYVSRSDQNGAFTMTTTQFAHVGIRACRIKSSGF